MSYSKLDKARWWVLRESVWYGSLTVQLKDVVARGLPSGTAATDGHRILWDVDFLAQLSDEEVRFVLLHETLHNAHGHAWRFDPKEPEAQLACDQVINGILRKMAGVKMPQGAFYSPQFDGKSEEDVYRILKGQPKRKGDGQKPEKQGNKQGQREDDGEGNSDQDGKGDNETKGTSPDPGQCGSFESPKGTPEAKAETKAKWQQAVVMAAQAAGLKKGELPGDLARLAGEACQLAKPDWRAETASWLKSAVNSTRNDWARNRKRMCGQPVIYARQRPNDLATVIAVRDTSGSIDEKTIGAFNELLSGLMSDTGCQLVLIDCDASVNEVYTLEAGEEMPNQAKGGGGTSFKPAIEYAIQRLEDGEQIAGLVYLTDLYGDFPEEPPSFPVLWVATTDQPVPWGNVVRV